MAFKKLNPILTWIGAGTACTLIYIFILTNHLSFLRQVGISLRFSFVLPLLALGVIFFILFKLPRRWGWWVSLGGVLAVFAFSLAGLWSSGQTEPSAISGLLPFADASSFYADAERLLEGRLFSWMSAQRPIHIAILSCLLLLSGGSLQITLGIFVLLSALACFALGREVLRTHGPAAATVVVVLLFFFIRRWGGTLMTETTGFPLGVVGVALLWRGIGRDQRWVGLLGMFVLTLGFMARPGPLMIFPLLVLWLGWWARKKDRFSWKYALLAGGAVVLGYAANMLVFWQVSDPGVPPFSSFANALYALASGGEHWSTIYIEHPELKDLSDAERTNQVYRYTLEMVQQHPERAWMGLTNQYGVFFRSGSNGAFAFLGGEETTINQVVQVGSWLLCLVGLVLWVMTRGKDRHFSLVLVLMVGVILSVPFAPPQDGSRLRMYAAGAAVLALMPALGIAFILGRFPLKFLAAPPDKGFDPNLSLWVGAGFTLLVLVSPWVVRPFARPSDYRALQCPEGQQVVYLRAEKDIYIHLVPEGEFMLDWMPDFHIGRFRSFIHSMPAHTVLYEFDDITAPAYLLTGLDLGTDKTIWMVLNGGMLPPTPAVLGACGHFSDNPEVQDWNIFYTTQVQDVTLR